jgi:hypothetical protein
VLLCNLLCKTESLLGNESAITVSCTEGLFHFQKQPFGNHRLMSTRNVPLDTTNNAAEIASSSSWNFIHCKPSIRSVYHEGKGKIIRTGVRFPANTHV